MTPVSRNEPRDQLAAIIGKGIDRSPTAAWLILPGPMNLAPGLANVAAAAAIAAGWRPPPRVIETAEELDALPELAVIRTDEGRVFEKVGSFPDPDQFGYRSDWMGMDSEFTLGTDEIDDLPATVLWEPKEAAGERHRIDVTHVAPGELERMARSGARPSLELQAAIDRARDRKGADRG